MLVAWISKIELIWSCYALPSMPSLFDLLPCSSGVFSLPPCSVPILPSSWGWRLLAAAEPWYSHLDSHSQGLFQGHQEGPSASQHEQGWTRGLCLGEGLEHCRHIHVQWMLFRCKVHIITHALCLHPPPPPLDFAFRFLWSLISMTTSSPQ